MNTQAVEVQRDLDEIATLLRQRAAFFGVSDEVADRLNVINVEEPSFAHRDLLSALEQPVAVLNGIAQSLEVVRFPDLAEAARFEQENGI